MEKRLKFLQLLSLKEISLRKVAVLLWSGPDILASISEFPFDIIVVDDSETEWLDTTEAKIKDKMLKLDLPEPLTKEMIERIGPIGLEISKWLESHTGYFIDSNHRSIPPDLTKLCWTSAGAINTLKTAEKLVHCDVLEINQRYRLACSYCFENDIPLLFEELPEEMKVFYKCKVSQPLLHYCWPYILKGELSELDYLLRTSGRNHFTFYQWAFEYSVESGNKTAAEYFFLKLSHEEKEDSLMRATRKITAIEGFRLEKLSPVLPLLSLMNPEQQFEVFASSPTGFLFSFLDWPFPDLFLENVGLIWDLLPPGSFIDMFVLMSARYLKSNFYIPKLFQELFVQSPLSFKKCFVEDEHKSNYDTACYFLGLLFYYEDAGTIGVIFRNLDAAERIKLFFSHFVLEELFHSVIEGRWHVVNVCLREVTLSDEDKERLKEAFIEFLKSNDAEEIDCGGQNSKKFLKLLDEPDVRAGNKKKRKLEDLCP